MCIVLSDDGKAVDAKTCEAAKRNNLATEMLAEMSKCNNRKDLIIIFLLVAWMATIGGFLWYISLPSSESTSTTVDSQSSGNANYINGKGEIYNGKDYGN